MIDFLLGLLASLFIIFWFWLLFLAWKGYQLPTQPLDPFTAFFYTSILPIGGWWKLYKHQKKAARARRR